MRELNIIIKGELGRQVYYFIYNISNLKLLCRNCKTELLILFFCYYVKCANSRYEPPEKYKICKEHGLTTKKYASLLTRLNKHLMQRQILPQWIPI